MGLTIIRDTHPMTPVRDPAWMEVDCVGYLSAAAARSEVRIGMIQEPGAGYTVYFTLPDGQTTSLVAVVTTPDDSGTQYTADPDLATSYANMLACALQNPYLTQWYQIQTVASNTMRLRAREVGAHDPLITWDTPACVALSGQVVGTPGTFAPAYTARLAVYLEETWGSGTYTRLPELEKGANSNARAAWDLSTMLRPYVRKSVVLDWPAYDLDEPTLATGIFRRYYIDRWERYGEPPASRGSARSDIKLAWYAGARNRDHNTDGELGDVLRYTHRATPWMTYRDRGGKHEVSAAQQHVLGFYRNIPRVTDEPVRFVATVYYTDGTNQAAPNIDDSAITWNQGTVALWPCGFDTLELGDVDPAKTPYKYTVKLVSFSDADLSETHTFWLADEDHNELHLEFLNSMGVVESMRCVGSWEQALDGQYEDLASLRESDNGTLPSAEQANTTSLHLGATATLQVSTGFLEATEHYALLDVITSPEVRLVDHRNDRKLPVRLAPSSHVVRRTGVDVNEHLYAINLALVEGDAEMAWGDRNLLPRLANPDTYPVPNVPQS